MGRIPVVAFIFEIFHFGWGEILKDNVVEVEGVGKVRIKEETICEC